jgi:hypothetical protein
MTLSENLVPVSAGLAQAVAETSIEYSAEARTRENPN